MGLHRADVYWMITAVRILSITAVIVGIANLGLFIFVDQKWYAFVGGLAVIAIGMWSLERLP